MLYIQISADIYIFTSLWLEGFSVNKLCSLDPTDCTTSELHLLRAHNVRLANVEKLWSPKIWTGMNRKIGFNRWNTVLMLLVPFLFVNAWVSKRIQEKEFLRVMQPFYQSSRVLAVAKLHSSSSSSSVLFLLLRTCLLEPQLKTRNLFRSTSSPSCIQRTHRLPLVLEALCCKSTSLCALADLMTCQNARESGQSMTFHPCKTAEISGFSSRSLYVWTKSSNSPAETWRLPSKSLISPRYQGWFSGHLGFNQFLQHRTIQPWSWPSATDLIGIQRPPKAFQFVSNVSAKFGGFLKLLKLPSSDLLWPKDF